MPAAATCVSPGPPTQTPPPDSPTHGRPASQTQLFQSWSPRPLPHTRAAHTALCRGATCRPRRQVRDSRVLLTLPRLSHSTVTPLGSCVQRPRGAPCTPPSHAPGAALSAQQPRDQPPRPRRCSVPPALPGSPELLGRWARPESKHAPSVRRTPRRVHPGNHCSTVASRKNDQITPGSQRSTPEC